MAAEELSEMTSPGRAGCCPAVLESPSHPIFGPSNLNPSHYRRRRHDAQASRGPVLRTFPGDRCPCWQSISSLVLSCTSRSRAQLPASRSGQLAKHVPPSPSGTNLEAPEANQTQPHINNALFTSRTPSSTSTLHHPPPPLHRLSCVCLSARVGVPLLLALPHNPITGIITYCVRSTHTDTYTQTNVFPSHTHTHTHNTLPPYLPSRILPRTRPPQKKKTIALRVAASARPS